MLQMKRLRPQIIGMSDQVIPGKDQKILTPVTRRRLTQWWLRLVRMVKRLYVCVNVERPRSSGNSKKSLNGLTSNDEAIYIAACHAQSNESRIYIVVSRLNRRPVKVLRDTRMIVDRALIRDVMVILGSSDSLQIVDHPLMGAGRNLCLPD